MKSLRIVQVLHKKNAAGHLAIGETFKFKSGAAYTVLASGAVIRVKSQPWKSKAEAKQHRRERRLLREQGQ